VTGLLADRVALVTGASRGIGAAIAERFAAEGAKVAVSARTLHDGEHVLPGGIEETASAIRARGGQALAVQADLSRAEDRRRLVEQVESALGPIDVLVNNAAVTYYASVEEFRDRHFELMFEVQVRAPFELARLVLPGMRQRRRGFILNISSAAARHPAGPPYGPAMGGTVYGMCKAAIERFSTGLAQEVYPDGIAVNALAPSGLVLTPGALHHHLDRLVPAEHHEPVELMTDAALALCSGDPARLTGRVAYARPLLEELGLLATS
jgi:citronellol/citronellal dehydrogenase